MSKRLNKIDAFESTVYTLVDWWGEYDTVGEAKAAWEAWLERERREAVVEELRDITGSLIDWDVMYGHEEGTPKTHEAHRIAAWIDDRADALEGGTRNVHISH